MVEKEKILVTGSAGFIGFHLCKRLLKENFDVLGFDNINNYYSKKLKLSRLKILKDNLENSLGKFTFVKGDLEKYHDLEKVSQTFEPKIIIHLAAQAGVRYSIEIPHSYIIIWLVLLIFWSFVEELIFIILFMQVVVPFMVGIPIYPFLKKIQ